MTEKKLATMTKLLKTR